MASAPLLVFLLLLPLSFSFLLPPPTTTHSHHRSSLPPLVSSPPPPLHTSNLLTTSIPSLLDGHPLTLYSPKSVANSPSKIPLEDREPVLLLHGRTWSSLAVYNLKPGPTLEAFPESFAPYTFDFRGEGWCVVCLFFVEDKNVCCLLLCKPPCSSLAWSSLFNNPLRLNLDIY